MQILFFSNSPLDMGERLKSLVYHRWCLYYLWLHISLTMPSATGQWLYTSGNQSSITAAANYVWGVDSKSNVYVCARPCYEWKYVDGSLVQVDASDDEVWGVNDKKEVFKRPIDGSGEWTWVPGKLKHVSASGNGFIWGVSPEENVFMCRKPCHGGRHWHHIQGPTMKQVDGGQAYVYGVNASGRIFVRPIDGSGWWTHIPGFLTHITGSGRMEVYGTNFQNEIWRCVKPCIGYWAIVPGHFKMCEATFDGLYAVDQSDKVYFHYLGI